MPDFLFAYHGGKKPETAEEGVEAMARWNAWFEGMGDAVVIPGAPVGMSKTVSASGVVDNGGANPISGYSVIRAETIEAVVEHAKKCPILDGGTIEVAPIMEM